MPLPLSRLLLSVVLIAPAAGAQESTADDQASLSLTVYQQGLGLVRDERTVDLAPGRAELAIRDVSAQLLPGSVALQAQPGLKVDAWRLQEADLSVAGLLQARVGESVAVMHLDPHSGQPVREEGVLLAASPEGAVVRLGDRIDLVRPGDPRWLAVAELPAGLNARPALLASVENATRGPQSLEISYLTHGLSWQADYVAVLAEDDGQLQWTAWVGIGNDTDTRYRGARVQLLAGDINQVQDGPFQARAQMAESAALKSQARHDYHVYDLGGPLTLEPRERLQRRLLGPRPVPVAREYQVQAAGIAGTAEAEPLPVQVRLLFENSEPHLGVPLPAGTVRVYGQGSAGPLFLGEDRIDHTTVGGELELTVGRAFDVEARRNQVEFRRIDDRTVEAAWELTLRNQKPRPVTVVYTDTLPGEPRVLSEDQPHEQVSARQLRWRLEVPAEGERRFRYRLQLRY